MEAEEIVAVVVVFVVGLWVYFTPSVWAWKRSHHNAKAIFILNGFLGWTVLGWIVALVWAMTAVQPPSPGRKREEG